jgi:hypothetical protein
LRGSDGNLRIVYYDHSQGDLKLATAGAGGFAVMLVDGGDPSTDVGQFAAPALGPDGVLHVAYQDAIADSLLYTTVAAGVAAAPEVIDDGLRDDGPHPVGAGAALMLEGAQVRVVYQDQLLSDLLEARRAGGWSHQPLDAGPAGYGWWPHLVADGNKLYLTQFVYDRSNGTPVGTLHIELLPP